MADDGEQIARFISLTNADDERARFYLSAANGDLNTAVATFFDSSANDGEDIAPSVMETEDAPPAAAAEIPDPRKSMPSKRGNKGNSRITTLASYNQSNSDSDDEEGQAFFAGGSETSGQQILGPNKKKKNADLKQNIFDAAKSHGAEVVTDEPSRQPRAQRSVFQGAGFTLGSNVDESKQIGTSVSNTAKADKPRTIVIKFWQNGFSIDDGPLRNPQDPVNSQFMEDIKRGQVPAELRQHARGEEVHVNMEDHSHEDYVKPKETFKAFVGSGNTLGSPTPNVAESSLPATTLPPAPTTTLPQQPAFKVDESKPVTTIQIRLADGTRLVTKFNTDNTVGDIRNVVRNARPGQTEFKLMTTFPNKLLSNDEETIEQAKLKNAVIVQRM